MLQSKKLQTVQLLTMNRLYGRKKYKINTIIPMRIEQFIEFFEKLYLGQIVYETMDGRIVDFLESGNVERKTYHRKHLL